MIHCPLSYPQKPYGRWLSFFPYSMLRSATARICLSDVPVEITVKSVTELIPRKSNTVTLSDFRSWESRASSIENWYASTWAIFKRYMISPRCSTPRQKPDRWVRSDPNSPPIFAPGFPAKPSFVAPSAIPENRTIDPPTRSPKWGVHIPRSALES